MMAGPSTAQEVLIAELLGDVGRLHDEIKALETRLPALITDAEAQLGGTIGKIVLAAKGLEDSTGRYKEVISKWTIAKTEEAGKKITKDVEAEIKMAKVVINELAGKALNDAAVALEGVAIEQKSAINAQTWNAWKGALIAAAGGGIIGAGLIYVLIK